MGKLKTMEVDILTADPVYREVCETYWEVNDQGQFALRVREVAESFGLDIRKLHSIVAENSRAASEDHICPNCGEVKEWSYTRENFRAGFHMHKVCAGCLKAEEEIAEREAEAQLQLATERAEEAFEKGVYESLSPLEFNFLRALSSEAGFERAAKSVGINQNGAGKMFKKLVGLSLIIFPEGSDGYSIVSGLKAVLAKSDSRRVVRSIFGSPAAADLYKRLKREHGFVFPEIPVCAFIDKVAVQHLFSKKWHFDYFLRCRLDFVVCDENGVPQFALEYQGGYHDAPDQRDKDEFKRAILEAAGIGLRFVDAKSSDDQLG
ncbi:MAG TPA: DUF2726 domain-containing protein [Candidatus Acidoferrales bacterium]|jgi:hypothetical protein|nr:DUF2726 domain-containing protein [Candidatus Acidoferrales bacterium]